MRTRWDDVRGGYAGYIIQRQKVETDRNRESMR